MVKKVRLLLPCHRLSRSGPCKRGGGGILRPSGRDGTSRIGKGGGFSADIEGDFASRGPVFLLRGLENHQCTGLELLMNTPKGIVSWDSVRNFLKILNVKCNNGRIKHTFFLPQRPSQIKFRQG
jgi:hypothetical protein